MAQTRMSAQEFLQLPESNQPTELINGEVIMAPAPELSHQDIVLQIAALLKSTIGDGKVRIAPVDVHLDEVTVVQPDVLWTAPNSQCLPVEGKHLRGAPELVVEVLSPTTARYDKGIKFDLYEQYGVREYWIVDPVSEYMEVFCLDDSKFVRHGVWGPEDTFASPLMGQINLSQIFEE